MYVTFFVHNFLKDLQSFDFVFKMTISGLSCKDRGATFILGGGGGGGD